MHFSLRSLGLAVVVFVVFGTACRADELSNVTQYVDPFIGTDWTKFPTHHAGFDCGNTFPGAAWPMGMVQWSPDTPVPDGIKGGYFYQDKIITGFPLTHFSGRGVTYLQDVPILPTSKAIQASPGTHWSDYCATFSHDHEEAKPGYYGVTFDDGVETELTVTSRTGIARIRFPANAHRVVLIKTNSQIDIIGKDRITGFHNATIGGGSRPYTVYFAAQFDHPFSSFGTWHGDSCTPNESTASDKSCGGWVGFDDSKDAVVEMKVGLSFVSIENAKANLAAENPGWDFEAVQKSADSEWNAQLGRIQVSGGSTQDMRAFYTALYHCFFHPNLLNDANGQYPGMDGAIHNAESGHNQYQNIPAWDQYRSFAALRAILTPKEMSDVAQSLVNYAEQDAKARPEGGGLPRWQQANRNSGGMVGDGDDAIIATAYAFGARDFDTTAALKAMDKGASVVGTTSDGQVVRQGLEEYLKVGYVPKRASITEEYCVNDFAISQFAGALGDEKKRVEYQNRSQNWKKLFNASSGYLEPRGADGSFSANFKPSGTTGFVEGSAAQYLWLVNFNFHGLFQMLGGDQAAIGRLDQFFTKLNGPADSTNAFMGNEPCEAAPWAYAFAGAPQKTDEAVRRIQNELFFDAPEGLPGNDDAGALSSWYVFSVLGLYPAIPGVGGLVIGSPRFSSETVQLADGSTIQIHGENASQDAPYVQDLKIDGNPWKSAWIEWSALARGAKLDFSLGKSPSAWGSGPGATPPPSFDEAGSIKH